MMSSYSSYGDETTLVGSAGLRDLRWEDIEQIVERGHLVRQSLIHGVRGKL